MLEKGVASLRSTRTQVTYFVGMCSRHGPEQRKEGPVNQPTHFEDERKNKSVSFHCISFLLPQETLLLHTIDSCHFPCLSHCIPYWYTRATKHLPNIPPEDISREVHVLEKCTASSRSTWTQVIEYTGMYYRHGR